MHFFGFDVFSCLVIFTRNTSPNEIVCLTRGRFTGATAIKFLLALSVSLAKPDASVEFLPSTPMLPPFYFHHTFLFSAQTQKHNSEPRQDILWIWQADKPLFTLNHFEKICAASIVNAPLGTRRAAMLVAKAALCPLVDSKNGYDPSAVWSGPYWLQSI